MKISIIIPNYNGLLLLKKNLPKVIAGSEDAEIIIVDDASTDGSADWLKINYPKIRLIRNVINEGFASTVNIGVTASTSELVLLLNSDVVPQSHFLAPLIYHFNSPTVFAVGALQKTDDMKSKNIQGRGIGAFKKGFLTHARGNPEKTNTLWVFGGAGMFRKDIWEKLGGVEKIYNPFYWEDIDLSYRALKSGYNLIFEPKSIVIHQMEKSSIRTNYNPDFIKTITYRNQILFVWLNITDFRFILSHIFYLPIHIARSLLKFDWAFISGFMKAVCLLPEVIRKRRNHKQKFIKKDSEVLAPFIE